MSSSKTFERTARSLDFNDIRQNLASHCKTDTGAITCQQLSPVQTVDEAIEELNLTGEMISFVKSGENLFPSQVDDPRKVTEKMETGTLPEPDDIKSMISFSRQLERVNEFKNSNLPNIKNLLEITNNFEPLEELVSFLETTFDSDGNVKPTATANLMQIENRINSLKKKIAQKAEALLLRDDVKDILQESYISVRNDRIVIPIKAEYKNIFPGIIHNISGSEHTAFMEPQELVKPNNSLREAISEREEEIRRLLRETATKLRENKKQIALDYTIIGTLDSINAKAQLSIKINGNQPNFSKDDSLSIAGLKNLLMLIMNEKPRPNNLEMGSKERSLLISGPNAGGKTVLLKSLGLAFILPSVGIFPPLSADSTLPFAKNVFAIIGDEQSIEDGQSTFSAQLIGIKDALISAGKGDLIIIDEILNGTDPQQASALAFTVIEKLIEKGCRVFVSTHLPDLKVSAQESSDMVNGAMGFSEDGKPSFKLEKGHPGVSYPLAVAEAVGIPLEIIKKAKERLTSSHDLYHDALMELQQKADKMDKATIEQEKLSREATRLAKDLKEKLDEANAELEKLEREKKKALREEITKARRTLSSMIDETKKADKKEMEKKSAELKKQENELTREILRPDSIPLEDVEIGGPVWIIPFDKKATLVKVSSDSKAEVMTGGVRMTLPKSNLVGIRGGEPLKKKKQPTRVVASSDDDELETEITLLGLTFEESLTKLEPFLDRHLLHGTPEVRVVHGKGILKSKLEDYFKASSYVQSFHPAMPAQGGDGASIVTLL